MPRLIQALSDGWLADASFAKDLDMLILSQNSTFVNVEATLQVHVGLVAKLQLSFARGYLHDAVCDIASRPCILNQTSQPS